MTDCAVPHSRDALIESRPYRLAVLGTPLIKNTDTHNE